MSSMLRTIAWGIIDGGAGTLVGRGATLDKQATGNYNIELSDGLQVDESEMMATFTPINNNDWGTYSLFTVLGEPDRIKNVQWRNNVGALIDVEFYFKFEKLEIL